MKLYNKPAIKYVELRAEETLATGTHDEGQHCSNKQNLNKIPACGLNG